MELKCLVKKLYYTYTRKDLRKDLQLQFFIIGGYKTVRHVSQELHSEKKCEVKEPWHKPQSFSANAHGFQISLAGAHTLKKLLGDALSARDRS